MNQAPYFHNTIALNSVELIDREDKAKNQTELIEVIFKRHPHRDFTPCEIYTMIEGKILLTSIRRSISNLTKAKVLVRTDNRRMGIYNEINHCWQLKKQTL